MLRRTVPIVWVMELLSLEKLSALVIEDNPDHVRLIRLCIERQDPACDLAFAASIREGVELLTASAGPRFDVVLLDLSLPDGDGLDNLRRIREHCGDTPLVVLTADDDTRLAIEAVRQGAEDYIIKQEMNGRLLVRAMHYATERGRLRRELVRVSLTDELTGLHNRRAFLTLSRQQLAVARRTLEPMLLVFADLDDLKMINDTQGHVAGDRAIVAVASALHACLREADVIARLGGDEFAVLMRETGPGAADVVMSRLEAVFERAGLQVSSGIVRMGPAEPVSLEDLMVRADKALYSSKRTRKLARVPALV